MTPPRLLVAGIGNIFLGDDAFGVHVAQRLARRSLPCGVTVGDFGIRGFDLALALVDGYAGVVLVDTTARGGTPGTLYVIEPEAPKPGEPATVTEIDPHGMDPVKVLRFASALGEVCPWVRIVGCEPLTCGTEDEPVMGLSEPVERAIDPAIAMVESLIGAFQEAATL
jgi:hydrogenase maturation protease